MTQEELFKRAEKEEIDKRTENMGVTVKFDVVCYSSPCVQNGSSIIARIAQYVNDCLEAMDDSMRHWGEHKHSITPVSIKIYYNDEEQEVIDMFDDYDNKNR